MDRGLTFDDVLLSPQYSDIETRSEVRLSTRITPHRRLDIPVWAANMDTVCGWHMAHEMSNLGGIGVIHRYMSTQEQAGSVARARAGRVFEGPIAAAVGVQEGSLDRAVALLTEGADILVIDVAHGDHLLVLEFLEKLHALNWGTTNDGKPVEFVAGNVATASGARRLVDAGAAAVKVGIGPGSLCTTREVTGHGVPQLTAIMRAATVTPYVIADGGIRKAGDIVKALAAGASSVMLGSLLAGTLEAPGETIHQGADERQYKLYRGMASFDAQKAFFGGSTSAPEGVARLVPYQGAVALVLDRLIKGVESGLSYSGARTIAELQEVAQWELISAAAAHESQPHGL